METKLGEIVEMLEYLVQQKNALGLREGAVEKASSQRIPTTSLVDESGVYGRDGDKEAIMKLVRSANENGKRLDIMAKGNSSRNFSLQSMKPLPTSEIKAKEETQIEVIHLASIVAEQAIHHSNAGKGLMQSVTSAISLGMKLLYARANSR
ncbi:hypothetical protein DKX38_006856 [Salix brachista]|uniref:Uncharacterized protein n=1 Tax=Salix brachista TaxID=2182728 RepID=A0A5N5MLU6_9ROSI|nr:hypothetical protein DKX38_006856 [Salix brachista]